MFCPGKTSCMYGCMHFLDVCVDAMMMSYAYAMT